IRNDIETLSDGYSYQIGIFQEETDSDIENTIPVLWANVFILASNSLTRDSFEGMAADTFFGNSLDKEGNMFVYYTILTDDIYNKYSSTNDVTLPIHEHDDVNLRYQEGGFQHSINLSSTLTCTFVTFQRSNFSVEWNTTKDVDNVVVTLKVAGIKFTISNMSDVNTMEVKFTISNMSDVNTMEVKFTISNMSDVNTMEVKFTISNMSDVNTMEVKFTISNMSDVNTMEVKFTISNMSDVNTMEVKFTISNMSDVNTMQVTTTNELRICANILDRYLKKSKSRSIRQMDIAEYNMAFRLSY
ncbi:adhesion G protein-coupled receptor E3, partial [Biomphalaria glabrata]